MKAVELLGTMLGGYNVSTLVELLDDPDMAVAAADELSRILLVFDGLPRCRGTRPTTAMNMPGVSCEAGPTPNGSLRGRRCRKN